MIGVFDSGSGGLTVLREIHSLLPHTPVLYFGDLKNAPYGSRSPEELGVLTVQGFKKLSDQGATLIVSACNSASANIVVPLFEGLCIRPENIIEMVGPTIKAFAEKKNKKILLVATEATVRSGVYQQAFHGIGIAIQTLALPHLARAIEEKTSAPAVLAMISEALAPYNGSYETLILACTHFPLVEEVFKRSVPEGVEIFDPAEGVAKEVVGHYRGQGSGKLQFLISKDSDFFRAKVAEFFGNSDYTIDVVS